MIDRRARATSDERCCFGPRESYGRKVAQALVKEGKYEDQSIHSPSHPPHAIIASGVIKDVERIGRGLEPVPIEAYKKILDSRSPSDRDHVEAGMRRRKHGEEEAAIQQISIPSTVHDLLRSGWRISLRSKPDMRLSERLEKLKAGTGIYVKPVIRNRGSHKPSDSATHYSVGVNLPNTKEVL